MAVTRFVPNLPVSDGAAARDLYAGLFELDVVMDHGWVACLAPNPAVQLQVLTRDAAAAVNPVVSIGVASPDEVDAVLARVRAAGLEIVHGPADEEWGVRRFFFRDPDGNIVNVVANL